MLNIYYFHTTETPPCLTSKILDEKYLQIDSPLTIYTSKQVEIYPLTTNKCSRSVIIYNFWEVYGIDTNGSETQIGNRTSTLKFTINSGAYEMGLYRLYIKIGYPSRMTYWMEESMYFRIVNPPPHAFIRGGAGLTVGKGITYFDASSGSYSLTKGPGDSSGLTFQWACMNFITDSLYKLVQLNIDPTTLFNDVTVEETKWYQTDFTTHIEEQVPWIDASMLQKRVEYYRNANTSCKGADDLYVIVESDNNTSTNLVNLTDYYAISYLSDITTKTNQLIDSKGIYPFPSYNTLVHNELQTFLNFYFSNNTSTFASDAEQFYIMLSNSYLTLETIYQLQGLDGLPVSADQTFFNDLSKWLQIAKQVTHIAYHVAELLNTFSAYQTYLNRGLVVADLIGVDGYLQILIDKSGACLLNFLGEIMEGFYKIDSYNWFEMKNTERFYLDWIEAELFKTSECKNFNGYINGTGSLNITDADVNDGMGYLVNVRVENEGAISYYIQYVQSVDGSPPIVEIE